MTGRRAITPLLVAAVGFSMLFSVALASSSPTGFAVASQFASFYARSGGLSNFGYAISPPETQSGRLVQYFERQRFENHPELTGTPYQVELGRLGADAAQSSGIINSSPFQALPSNTTSNANCTFFPQTRHRLCAGFRSYWQSNGVEFGDPGVSFRESLALFGFPISEEFRDPTSGLVVQYFERARFEYHPEFAGTKYAVELTLLGDVAMNGDYGTVSRATGQNVAPSASPVRFGVYPGGGTGETGYVGAPSEAQIVGSLNQLRGSQTLNVHLYTAWSWYNQQTLDDDIARYTGAGFHVTLTIKYSPPTGHVGDVNGFKSFVSTVVNRYGTNTNVSHFVIGNEINVASGNSGSSDGPISGVRAAVVQGVIAASQDLSHIGSHAQVGTDLAVQDRNADAQFMKDLTQQGGDSFKSAISFLGINVYPGLWPVGSGDPYGDMTTYLRNARYSLTNAGLGSNVTIDILENGFPTLNQADQANKLDAFVRAVCDNASSLGISGYTWFDLWDANSSSSSIYGHYGLLTSNMKPKSAFNTYQQAIAGQCSGSQ